MGNFLDPQEAKDKAVADVLRQLDIEALDDLYILPAESLIEQSCNLRLDTDLDPTGWSGRFDNTPSERTKFRDAYRRATLITVNRMGANPHAFRTQSIGGASVAYDPSVVPREAKALLTQWTIPRTVFRA